MSGDRNISNFPFFLLRKSLNDDQVNYFLFCKQIQGFFLNHNTITQSKLFHDAKTKFDRPNTAILTICVCFMRTKNFLSIGKK